MNILLVGLPGSGKTTLGKKLGEKLSLPFIDTDKLIEERVGISCRELYEKSEEEFRAVEREVLLSLNPEKAVLALGGGAVLHEELFPHLQSLGPILYLYEEPMILFERLQKRGFPATLGKENPLDGWLRLLEKRLVMYHYLSDLTIYGEQQFWDLFSDHDLRGVARAGTRRCD